MVHISPSILSADFACLGREVQRLETAGADLIHIDVMDGHFVPNLTFGPCVIKDIRPYTELSFDVHLMMTHPSRFVSAFAEAGADMITIHLEACEHPADVISRIRSLGKKVGVSLRPSTKVADVIPYLPDIDLVLVMAVEPGFGGQPFQKEAIAKIAALKELIGHKPVQISVDGGITDITAPACVLAGADILVSGSYIFKNRSYKQAITTLKKG